jgi:HPt (histidine-containing phosphotransfer) domain-containing protein
MMREMISSAQIDRWFESTRRDAQEILPHLVRRLINETVPRQAIQELRIPVGDDIGHRGYDGVVVTNRETGPYVPMEKSVWEMSTGDAEGEFKRNYKKRTEGPHDYHASFIFVTPHDWHNKKKLKGLLKKKRQEKKWRAVQVIDCVDLEHWLEVSPAAARWLLLQMGLPMGSFFDLKSYVAEEIDAKYGVALSPQLIIGGRNEDADELGEWLALDDAYLQVIGETDEEAVAFITAVVQTLPEEEREFFNSRLLFVREIEALQFLTLEELPYCIIPLAPEVELKASTLALKGVRILAPRQREEPKQVAGKGEIVLGTVRRNAIEDALEKMGLSSRQARIVAKESKGSLAAVLWQLQEHKDARPPWASAEEAIEVLPMLLAGQWFDDNEADQQVLEAISGRNYEEIKQCLVRWQWPNGPFICRGQLWDWLAWPFVFSRLAQFVDQVLVNRFQSAAFGVLAELDPSIELAPEDRWTAAFYNKTLLYSGALRSGLAGAIALLAVHGERLSGVEGQVVANALVRKILHESDELGARWFSVAPLLEDLAEAAPEVFLEGVERLVKDESAISTIFQEGGHFGSSPHTYVLWALERLAWSEDHLTRATVLLGGLADKDPGGRLSNRPANSLTQIFLPWRPQTLAQVDARLDAIDVLYDVYADVAWTLGVSLFPGRTTTAFPISEPQWRDWKPSKESPTPDEYRSFAEGLIDRMVVWAGRSGTRWAQIVENLSYCRGISSLQIPIVDGLRSLDSDSLPSHVRKAIADALREVLNRHRSHKNAKWALSDEELEPLDELFARFEPADAISRNLWLFVPFPDIPELRDTGIKERFARLRSLRKQALQEVYDSSSIEGVAAVVGEAERPSDVGTALADLGIPEDDEIGFLVRSLAFEQTKEATPSLLQAAWAYIAERYHKDGNTWLDRIAAEDRISAFPNSLANLALGLPADGLVWDKVASWGSEVEKLFWTRIGISVLRDKSRDGERAIRALLSVNRPYRALHLACLAESAPSESTTPGPKVFSPDLIYLVLSQLPGSDPTEEWYAPDMNSSAYYVEKLLSLLDEADLEAEKLIPLEFALLPLLEHSERGPKCLLEALMTEPGLFVELLKLAYRGENEEPRQLSNREQASARLAHRLLSSLRTVPGLIRQEHADKAFEKRFDGDVAFAVGEVDREALLTWVNQARETAAECDRLEFCDSHIGQLLAYSPTGSDGTWPCLPVRELIEQLAEDAIEHGLAIGVFNKRGVHFRGPGGEQERAIAERFNGLARATRSKWPRTSSVLRKIAEQFERDARREDEEDRIREFE